VSGVLLIRSLQILNLSSANSYRIGIFYAQKEQNNVLSKEIPMI
jgi:hypothetical protein